MKTAKKTTHTLRQPFKKVKPCLSAHSTSSTTINPEIGSDNALVIATDVETESVPDHSNIEIVEVDPENELSMPVEYPY